MTTSLSGVKLVNAVKAITTPDGTQQQTIFIKQQQQQQQQPPEQQQQQQTIIGTIQQPPQLLQQHANKVSRVTARAASIGMHSETILRSFGRSHEHGRVHLVQ